MKLLREINPVKNTTKCISSTNMAIDHYVAELLLVSMIIFGKILKIRLKNRSCAAHTTTAIITFL